MNTRLVNIIFGMKVKHARQDSGLTLTEFAAQCDLSPSYVTEIEKGRKYPRADKIMRIAEVLDKEYDDLVSIRLEPPLTHLGAALSSPVLGQFPFEEFGIEMSDLVNVLTRAPDKASALLHAIAEVSRQYDLKEQHFLWSALRSYQELHENYFPDLEDAAAKFAKRNKLWSGKPISLEKIREILVKNFGYRIDEERLGGDEMLGDQYRSVFIKGARPKLLINSKLHPHQTKFLLAREIGYQFLKLTDRAYTSSPDQVDSFQQVFNDFKASYFAGALLMPRAQLLDDIQAFFGLEEWSQQPLLDMLHKYQVSPENLLYRFSELIPQFFGLKLHYLRVQDQNSRYSLVKQLNLTQLRVPNGLAVDEHFCRHWLVVRLLREMRESAEAGNEHSITNPIVGAQMSEYLDAKGYFLCFGFARPLPLEQTNSCGIIGFRVEPELKSSIRFADDALIPQVIINETCERCHLSETQCNLRAAPPTVLTAKGERNTRKQALRQLIAEMRR